MKEFFGVVAGSKTNPPQCDREGKLVFFATKQEAAAWGNRKWRKFHIVPLDWETIIRQRGNLMALGLWEVARVTELVMSAIVEMTASLAKIVQQCPQLAEVSKTEDKGD